MPALSCQVWKWEVSVGPMLKRIAEAGIILGIKVDTGATDMAGQPRERITDGLDGLRDRLKEYLAVGTRFAKWRAVIALGEGGPSRGCVEANAQALARYAALCQEAGLDSDAGADPAPDQSAALYRASGFVP